MLDEMEGIDFEYEGEMPPELALEPKRGGNFPFMRLSGPANVLIMPAIHSAAISTQLIKALGEATVIGPILQGLNKAVQICPLSASVSRILQTATVAPTKARWWRPRGRGLTSPPAGLGSPGRVRRRGTTSRVGSFSCR